MRHLAAVLLISLFGCSEPREPVKELSLSQSEKSISAKPGIGTIYRMSDRDYNRQMHDIAGSAKIEEAIMVLWKRDGVYRIDVGRDKGEPGSLVVDVSLAMRYLQPGDTARLDHTHLQGSPNPSKDDLQAMRTFRAEVEKAGGVFKGGRIYTHGKICEYSITLDGIYSGVIYNRRSR